MKVTVNTKVLQNAIDRVVKASSVNKLVPMSRLVGVKAKNGTLMLCGTDGNISVNSIILQIAGDDFDVTVELEKFSKLVSKLRKETTDLYVEDGNLKVASDGKYMFAIESDENGEIIFPEINSNIIESHEVLLTSALTIYNTSASALSKEAITCSNYYISNDLAIATDGERIAFNKMNAFNTDEPMLITAKTMKLLTMFPTEHIEWGKNASGKVVYKVDNLIIEDCVTDGVEEYPAESIREYLNEAFKSSCKVSKSVLVDALSRLELFISATDFNAVKLHFTRRGIVLSTVSDTSTETVSYLASENFEENTATVDILMLKEQVNAMPEDTIELHYGNEEALKLTFGNVTNIICQLETE